MRIATGEIEERLPERSPAAENSGAGAGTLGEDCHLVACFLASTSRTNFKNTGTDRPNRLRQPWRSR